MADEKCLHAAWSAQEGGGWECMFCRYRIAYDPQLAVDQVIKVANERDAALLKLDSIRGPLYSLIDYARNTGYPDADVLDALCATIPEPPK